MVAILGFVSAVVYGASDFLGGLASRRMSSLLASFIGFVVALIVTAVALLIEQPVWSPKPSASAPSRVSRERSVPGRCMPVSRSGR